MENGPQNIGFLPYHRPTLASGKYKITLKQDIQVKGHSQGTIKGPETYFFVRGERFNFKADWIDSVFPPAESDGDYDQCLPHIVLRRKTLPWERTVNKEKGEDDFITWLALLTFDEEEMRSVTESGITLEDLDEVGKQGLKENLELGEELTDKCRVVGIPEALLDDILPCLEDMKYLAHIRKVSTEKKQVHHPETGERGFAVVVGNRLLSPGKKYAAYLVSLQGFYDHRRDSWYAAMSGAVHLVYFKAWRFKVSDAGENFKKNLLALDRGVIRSQKNENQRVETFHQKGYTFLPHRLRQGDKTISLYRGPFLPYLRKQNNLVSLPAEHPDQLIRYDSQCGLFDVSYAAAWQLGRLLSLKNSDFAMSLTRWKMLKQQKVLVKRQKEKIEQELGRITVKSGEEKADPEESILKELRLWLGRLKLFDPLPLNYLVPKEDMLPGDSIRFITADSDWIDCLIDGACSLGRFGQSEMDADAGHLETLGRESDIQAMMDRNQDKEAVGRPGALTGFLLRSRVIIDWPGLEIDAYSAGNEKLSIYTMRKLSQDIMLCLFNGEIQKVAIHHPPEGLHFGISMNGMNKKLRDRTTGGQSENTIAVVFRNKDKQILNIFGLAKEMEKKLVTGDSALSVDSGEFAFQMIESADSVSFIKQ